MLACNRLKRLRLCKASLDDKGLEEIIKGFPKNTSLETFDLSYSSITSRGLAKLGEAMNGGAKRLQTLVVRGVRSIEPGSHYKAFIGSLKTNTTLIELDFEQCGLTTREARIPIEEMLDGPDGNHTLLKIDIRDESLFKLADNWAGIKLDDIRVNALLMRNIDKAADRVAQEKVDQVILSEWSRGGYIPPDMCRNIHAEAKRLLIQNAWDSPAETFGARSRTTE